MFDLKLSMFNAGCISVSRLCAVFLTIGLLTALLHTYIVFSAMHCQASRMAIQDCVHGLKKNHVKTNIAMLASFS